MALLSNVYHGYKAENTTTEWRNIPFNIVMECGVVCVISPKQISFIFPNTWRPFDGLKEKQ